MGSESPFSGSISPSGSDIEKSYSGSCPSPMRVCVCRSLSQSVLTQRPSLSAILGSSTRLTCILSSGFRVGSYDIYWFHQQPWSPPQYLLRFYSDSDSTKAPGSPNASVVPKMHQAKYGFCSCLGCGLSRRLTITVIHMALGTAPDPHSISDNEEVRPGTRDLVPETLVFRSFCAVSCRGEYPVGRPVLEGEE